MGGAEEINSEQVINGRLYCQVMNEAANVQSGLKIFWKGCKDLTVARGWAGLTQSAGMDEASAVTLGPGLPEALGFSLASTVGKQDLGCGTRRPVGQVGIR